MTMPEYTWPLSDPKSQKVMEACLRRGYSFKMDQNGIHVPYKGMTEAELLLGVSRWLEQDAQGRTRRARRAANTRRTISGKRKR